MMQRNAIHEGDREATDAEVEHVMAEGEQALDALAELFLRARARDRAAGNHSDEPALGGVAMALNDLSRDQLILIASLAIRRATKAASNG